MKTLCLFLIAIVLSFNAFSQNFYDNPYKVWGHPYEKSIKYGSVHISRADTSSEKIFHSLVENQSLPENIWQFRNLKVLDINRGYNSGPPTVGHVPGELNKLTKLEYIYFEGLNIESLPTDLSKLANLKSLYMTEAGNSDVILKKLPDFSKLKALEVVVLNLNNKTDMASVENFSTIFQSPGLKILVLSNSSINAGHMQLARNLTGLQIVEMTGNQLTKAPDIFSNTSLKQLSFRENQLETIGNELGNLTELEVLDIGYNKLTALPESIGNLVNLKMLELGTNKLEKLPLSIENLSKLEFLVLRENDFKEIPEGVYKLKNLKDLDLISTRISTIDEKILNTNIQALRISHKQPGSFNFDPIMLAKMKSLKKVQFSPMRGDEQLMKSIKKLKELRPDISF
jgi:Leucine-rich repeat (LRR) protein